MQDTDIHIKYNIKLLQGFNDFLENLISNKGHISYSITDQNTFKVGKNIAITSGKVIYQNELIQLIQYIPTTKKVYDKPILFIPPFVNKYYVLDLTPEKSLVKWLVDQGFTVFMISWINPDENLSEKGWGNYLLEGPIASINVITEITKCKSVHLVGYCIGGTLLACTLAYMKYINDNRAASGTYFTTLLDFTNSGILGSIINEPLLNFLTPMLESKGILSGKLIDIMFNMIKANEILLPHFVNTYILEKPLKTFDVLSWNADSINLTKEIVYFYFKNMYVKNILKNPNEIKIYNVPIDLSTINIPTCFISTEKDHIAPWEGTYDGIKCHGGPVNFILSGSGHVVGIINPPLHNKYFFKTNPYTYNTATQWLETAFTHDGSWWPYWKQWLIYNNNRQISSKKLIIPKTRIMENAPGTYALKRI